jgi:hypothetical protein
MKKKSVVRLCAAAVVLLAVTFSGCQTVVEPVAEPVKRVASVPLSIQVYGLYRSADAGPLLPIAPGAEMNSGDQYKLFFRANRDCYVYVYQAESTGKVFRLFPMQTYDGVALNHRNPVQTLADYVLPANDRYFYLDDTTGKEKIYFVASMQRNQALETLDARLTRAMQGSDDKLIVVASRKILDYLTDRGISAMAEKKTLLVAWGAGERVAPITGYVFETEQTGGVHAIEFLHR